MTDLARRAAGLIVDDVVYTINRIGTFVSHEDAALLREVKRALAGACILKIQVGVMSFEAEVYADHGLVRAIKSASNASAALKSALDAAGVPDAKGT